MGFQWLSNPLPYLDKNSLLSLAGVALALLGSTAWTTVKVWERIEKIRERREIHKVDLERIRGENRRRAEKEQKENEIEIANKQIKSMDTLWKFLKKSDYLTYNVDEGEGRSEQNP